MRKQSYFHIPEFSQMGLMEHEFLGILLVVRNVSVVNLIWKTLS